MIWRWPFTRSLQRCRNNTLAMPFGMEKLEWSGYSMVKNFDDNRFQDMITRRWARRHTLQHERDGQTGGWIDRHRAARFQLQGLGESWRCSESPPKAFQTTSTPTLLTTRWISTITDDKSQKINHYISAAVLNVTISVDLVISMLQELELLVKALHALNWLAV